MSRATRLTRLEASITSSGDGSPDLCPAGGGLNIEMLMEWVYELQGSSKGEAAHGTDEACQEDAAQFKDARCQRCGAQTLAAVLAGHNDHDISS